jgi:DedD protein
LVGAVVLVSLTVIFLPMLLEEREGQEVRIDSSNIPPKPQVDEAYHSRVLPLPDDEPLIPALTPEEEQAAEPSTDESPAADPGLESAPEPRLGISAWVVQVASLSNRDNAEALVAELRKRDHSAFMEQVYVNGKQLHRVRVGPEVDRERAQAEAQAIFDQLKVQGQVVRYP